MGGWSLQKHVGRSTDTVSVTFRLQGCQHKEAAEGRRVRTHLAMRTVPSTPLPTCRAHLPKRAKPAHASQGARKKGKTTTADKILKTSGSYHPKHIKHFKATAEEHCFIYERFTVVIS